MYEPHPGWDPEYVRRIGDFKLRVFRQAEDKVYVWYWTILQRRPGNSLQFRLMDSSGGIAFLAPADAMAEAEGVFEARWGARSKEVTT